MPSKIRNYRQEYDRYQGTALQKKRRAKRNKARQIMEDAGLVKKGDCKDVDHKKALSKNGSNSRDNLRAISQGKNRSYKRNKDGSMK